MKARVFVAAVATLIAAVSAASLAWACVPGASITLNKRSAAPGETLTGTFTDFAPDLPIEVRLNGEAGPVLASSASRPAAGSFTMQLPIPATTPAGCHVVVAFVTSGQHQGHSSAPTPLEVATEAAPNPGCSQPPPPGGGPCATWSCAARSSGGP